MTIAGCTVAIDHTPPKIDFHGIDKAKTLAAEYGPPRTNSVLIYDIVSFLGPLKATHMGKGHISIGYGLTEAFYTRQKMIARQCRSLRVPEGITFEEVLRQSVEHFVDIPKIQGVLDRTVSDYCDKSIFETMASRPVDTRLFELIDCALQEYERQLVSMGAPSLKEMTKYRLGVATCE